MQENLPIVKTKTRRRRIIGYLSRIYRDTVSGEDGGYTLAKNGAVIGIVLTSTTALTAVALAPFAPIILGVAGGVALIHIASAIKDEYDRNKVEDEKILELESINEKLKAMGEQVDTNLKLGNEKRSINDLDNDALLRALLCTYLQRLDLKDCEIGEVANIANRKRKANGSLPSQESMLRMIESVIDVDRKDSKKFAAKLNTLLCKQRGEWGKTFNARVFTAFELGSPPDQKAPHQEAPLNDQPKPKGYFRKAVSLLKAGITWVARSNTALGLIVGGCLITGVITGVALAPVYIIVGGLIAGALSGTASVAYKRYVEKDYKNTAKDLDNELKNQRTRFALLYKLNRQNNRKYKDLNVFNVFEEISPNFKGNHALAKLKNFSEIIGEQIITDLESLAAGDNKYRRQHVSSLRKRLQAFLSRKDIKRHNLSLSDAVYDSLLALAELEPENSINADDARKVYVSTGHQFDIYKLVNFHNARPFDSKFGDSSTKALINPLTNEKFSPEDVAHIQAVAAAAKREIKIHDLKKAPKLPKYVSTATRARIISHTIAQGLYGACAGLVIAFAMTGAILALAGLSVFLGPLVVAIALPGTIAAATVGVALGLRYGYLMGYATFKTGRTEEKRRLEVEEQQKKLTGVLGEKNVNERVKQSKRELLKELLSAYSDYSDSQKLSGQNGSGEDKLGASELLEKKEKILSTIELATGIKRVIDPATLLPSGKFFESLSVYLQKEDTAHEANHLVNRFKASVLNKPGFEQVAVTRPSLPARAWSKLTGTRVNRSAIKYIFPIIGALAVAFPFSMLFIGAGLATTLPLLFTPAVLIPVAIAASAVISLFIYNKVMEKRAEINKKKIDDLEIKLPLIQAVVKLKEKTEYNKQAVLGEGVVESEKQEILSDVSNQTDIKTQTRYMGKRSFVFRTPSPPPNKYERDPRLTEEDLSSDLEDGSNIEDENITKRSRSVGSSLDRLRRSGSGIGKASEYGFYHKSSSKESLSKVDVAAPASAPKGKGIS